MKNINLTFRRSRARIAVLGAALLLPAGAVVAAPATTWIGGSPPGWDANGPVNSWSDPSNWSSGIVPGDGTQDPEDVTIGQAGDWARHGGDHTINSLSNAGKLDLLDGSYLTVVGGVSNDGLITADNSFSNLDIGGDLTNNATGNITANYVCNFGVSVGGDLNNAGHMGALYGAGQQNLLGIGVTGNISNTGTIDSNYGGATALLSQTGSLTNDGTVGATHGGTTLVLANGITNNNAIYGKFGGGTILSSQGDIVNNGSIESSFGGEVDAVTTGSFTNTGSVSAINGTLVSLEADGAVTNAATGTVNASLYGEVDLLGGDDITNHGAIKANMGGVVYIDTTNGLVYNDGSIITETDGGVIVTGDLIQTGGQTKINGYLDLSPTCGCGGNKDGTFYLEDGSLGGGGEIYGSVVQDGGTFAPGDPTTTYITGDYEQNGGVTKFVIDSVSDFDRIDIGGDYLYNGGTIDFEFTSNFFNGQFLKHPYEFDFLHFANFIGDPSAIQFTTNLRPDDVFHFDLDSSSGVYSGVFESSVTVPEPGSGVVFLTLASGLGLLLWTARRRKTFTN
ncbi:MAG: tandem-95 repeat protein [Capsulimonas sp.]|jgi:hypothetical protein|nr:tandem-95 repeat protein [Capsulimonas sp.]